MGVLGADPDAPDSGSLWDDEVTLSNRLRGTKFAGRDVYDLIVMFKFHPKMPFSVAVNAEDTNVLRFTLSRLTKAGFTKEQLEGAIDKFFNSVDVTKIERPALYFSKKEILFAMLGDSHVERNLNPIMQWFVDGLEEDAIVAGMEDDPRDVKNLILLTCDESLYRYPHVVADVVKYAPSLKMMGEWLRALEELVQYNLAGVFSDDIDNTLAVLKHVDLPAELMSRRPAPKGIRHRSKTISEAVATSPYSREEEDNEW